MKKWANPEIATLNIDSTETLKNVKVEVLGSVRVEDTYRVMSEGSTDPDLPS